MRVLIICSGNSENFNFKIHQAFIYEQIEAVKTLNNIDYDTYLIIGKGFIGYLRNLSALNSKIKRYSPDLVHAHFGLSGLLACLQRKARVVITFHGSDGNIPQIRFLSKIAAQLSHFNIYVSDQIQKLIKVNNRGSIIPCGINLDVFYPIDLEIARAKLNMKSDKKFILFSSNFMNSVKNSSLAFSAIRKLQMNIELIELKNKNRDEVNLLLNASNLLLLTSKTEGSPQIIKEAMACNCPIVSTDVGDIREIISNTEGCYLTSFNSEDVTDKIKLAIKFGKRTNGREMINRYDNKLIAEKISKIYKSVVEGKDDYGY